jgi:hypothetical protein
VTERENRPAWDGKRGRYEAWFLTMSDPEGNSGYWIRYSLRAPVAGPPERKLWFARFDRADPSRTFGINGFAEGRPVQGPMFGVGEALLDAGAARGSLKGGGHEARWDVRWPTGQPTFRILPPPLYRAPLASTRPYAPNPDVRFGGTVEVDGETVDLDGFAGQQGHVEGTRHAERWAWAHCNAFGQDGYAFQALSAQVRRGPFLTPMLTYGGLRVDGTWERLRGGISARSWSLGIWRLRLASATYRVDGEIRAPWDVLVRARYLDPDDTPRWCHNSEVASSRLLVWERRDDGWQELAELVSEGTTQAEWAGKTAAPGDFIEHEEIA